MKLEMPVGGQGSEGGKKKQQITLFGGTLHIINNLSSGQEGEKCLKTSVF